MSKVAPVQEPSEISNPILLEQYIVLAAYKKVNKNELSINKGDILEVVLCLDLLLSLS